VGKRKCRCVIHNSVSFALNNDAEGILLLTRELHYGSSASRTILSTISFMSLSSFS
jgi:hypothetical protein